MGGATGHDICTGPNRPIERGAIIHHVELATGLVIGLCLHHGGPAKAESWPCSCRAVAAEPLDCNCADYEGVGVQAQRQ